MLRLMTSGAVQAFLIGLFLVPYQGAALAGKLDGWCFPGDGCTGQVTIESGGFHTCEQTCTMKNAVRVNNMDATLYDVTCKGDGGPDDVDSRRMLFVRLQDEPGNLIEAPRSHFYPRSDGPARALAITNNGVTELVRCE